MRRRAGRCARSPTSRRRCGGGGPPARGERRRARRGVATLVAQEASAEAVLTAIAEECGRLFGTTNIGILRYEGDRHVVLAITGEFADIFPVGSETSLHEERAASRVYRTGAPVRIEDFMAASEAPVSGRLRALGLRSEVATPIMVEGRLWGAMVMATTRPEPLPPDTEARLGQFTELMATTIANTESRARVDRLTGEQDALRRLATLVAQGTPLETVFAKVAEEVASTTFGEADTALWRDDGDGSVTAVAARAANPAS